MRGRRPYWGDCHDELMAIFAPVRIMVRRVVSAVSAVISLNHHRRISMPFTMGIHAMVIVPVDKGTTVSVSVAAIVMWSDRDAARSHR